MDQKRTLIYILGAGRSGTTILDIILGNNARTLSLGEINRFFKRKGIPPKRSGEDQTYIFWQSVKKKFDLTYREQPNYEYLTEVTYKNEYHSSFLRSFRGNIKKDYIEAMNALYSAIFKCSDHSFLVESSKYPLRALNISRIFENFEVEVKYIYLKKDPVRVVRSFRKKGLEQPSKGFLAANIYYFLVNALCLLTLRKLRKRGHKVAEITFEKLISDPGGTLGILGKKLKLNVQGSQDKVLNGALMKTGYLFDGNRIRLNSEISLQKPQDIMRSYSFGDYFTRVFNYLIYR